LTYVREYVDTQALARASEADANRNHLPTESAAVGVI
jgi:hypothetical protein